MSIRFQYDFKFETIKYFNKLVKCRFSEYLFSRFDYQFIFFDINKFISQKQTIEKSKTNFCKNKWTIFEQKKRT